ncbi:MAG: signal peptidase I [Patescibacteria group bacterium]
MSDFSGYNGGTFVMPPEENRKTIFTEIKEIFRILIISLLVVIPIRFFVAQPFIVRGPSMEPNFHDGQYLVIDELKYRFTAPQRGEVVVFRYPNDPSQFFIKRIIGLPGETVSLEDGHVRIVSDQGKQVTVLNESYIDSSVLTAPDGTITLKAEEYFVLGDNRPMSSDSRVWGVLPYDKIVGRVLLRLWPPNKIVLY